MKLIIIIPAYKKILEEILTKLKESESENK